ncbi:MAG: 23S rRNA (guanosine(2251)-2'-O)-methyltransferase RlmB [Acidimicrobiales bacterium]|nr:23S rRNA (guanosine(2251)-2'-O)-methyltransferase RlmB [Acidimicrobiales bacterium]
MSKPGGRGRSGGGRGRGSGGAGRGSAGRGSGGRGGAPKRAASGGSRRGREPDPRSPAGADAPDAAAGPRRRRGPRGLGGDQVEGRQAVRELLLAGHRRVAEVLVADGSSAPIVEEILALADDARVTVRTVSRTRLDGAARTEAPQGVIAYADPIEEVDVDDLASGAVRASGSGDGPPFLLALDGVTDPGNLGAMLRSASAAGVTGVVLPRHRAVHVTPTVAKAAAGAIEHLPIAVVGGLPAALSRWREQGLWSAGLDAEGGASVWDLEVGDRPVVLVVGAEGSGLSRLVRQRCDQVVSIPMWGPLDSLNAGVAAAIACFEVARVRR